MIDFIWSNFGLIEWILVIIAVTLITAGLFYQVARLIARQDRHDPLVKFYRVFWQAFFSKVMSVKEIDLLHAEMYARDANLVSAGRLDDDQLGNLEAPDLGDMGGVESGGMREPDQGVPSSVLEAIGDDDDDQVDEPMPKYAATPAPRKGGPGSNAAAEEQRALKSTFDVRINGFSPKDEIVGCESGELVVNVTVSPEDGQANGVIINLVSARMRIPPYQIALLRGHYKVRKTFQVAGMDQAALNARMSAL